MIHRHLALPLHRAAADGSAVLLQGPRSAGKTTLLRREFPGHTYVSLEDPDTRDQARESPSRFLARLRGPSIIDDLHRAPELIAQLQAPENTGPWLFASSLRISLPLPVHELHAPTRAERERRPPLSLDMLGRFVPSPAHAPPLAPAWPPGHRDIENDIRGLVRLHDFDRFERFLRHARESSGQILDQQALARAAGVAHRTAVRWPAALDACFLTLLLPPADADLGRRTLRRPILHFLDSPNFPSQAISELYRNARHAGDTPNLRHWRDSNGFGLPLVVQPELGPPLPVEMAAAPTPSDTERLRRWMRLANVTRGALISAKPAPSRTSGILRYSVDQL